MKIIINFNDVKDKSGIYCFKNKINGKMYIGQSKNLKKRIFQHISKLKMNKDAASLLQKAWNKYGANLFDIFLIKTCAVEILDEKEITYIKKFHSHVSENGYNISWGGNSPNKNIKSTLETRKKISKNNAKYWLGKTLSKATINKIIKTKKENPKIVSEDTRKKMSEVRIGKKQSNGLTSKYVGTYKRNDMEKYRSSIKKDGIVYNLGTFDNEDDAAREYDKMYRKLFNKQTAPNFPNE